MVRNPSPAVRQKYSNRSWKKPRPKSATWPWILDDLVLYAIYPVTGKKFLQWKYGKEEAPDSVKPITMDEVKKREALVKKALAGELIEKKTDAPAKGENSAYLQRLR